MDPGEHVLTRRRNADTEDYSEDDEVMVLEAEPKSTVLQRLCSCFSCCKVFSSHRFQHSLVGCIASITMNELGMHLILKRSATAGELPAAVNEIVFAATSGLEAILAPFICWLGYRRRIDTIASWILLSAVLVFPLIFLSMAAANTTNTDLCNGLRIAQYSISGTSIARTVLVILMLVTSAGARVAVFSHGIAVLDEHKPEETSRHVAIMLGVRVLMLILLGSVIRDSIENRMGIMVFGFFAQSLVSGTMLFTHPRQPPKDKDFDNYLETMEAEETEKRGFLTSLGRVVTNKTAMTHVISAAMLSSAVWGMSLYQNDIVKSSFYITQSVDFKQVLADKFRLSAFVISLAVITGYQFSAPVMVKFDQLLAMRKAVFLTVLVGVLALVMTFLPCDEGTLAGMTPDHYTQPQCSQSCGCAGRYEFAPVCVLQEMTTFYSPCHAGCTARETVNGTTVLMNCACSSNFGWATVGSCKTPCVATYNLHQILFSMLLASAVATFTLHCLVILRSVDQRDKSTALGVAFSVIAMTSSVASHLAFWGISSSTCAWHEAGRCQIHTQRLALLIGVTCASLAAVSAVVNLVSWFIAKRRAR